jgi:hypothetical protein
MANTTWNPADKTAGITLSGTNNLTVTASNTGNQNVRAIDRNLTGKFYWEHTFTTIVGTCGVGLLPASASLSGVFFAGGANTCVTLQNVSGAFYIGTAQQFQLGALANGNVACFALDLGAQLIWVRVGAAGNWNNNSANNPATGVGGLSIAPVFPSIVPVYPWTGVSTGSGTVITANFGDSAFSGTVPSGFTSGFTSGATPPLYDMATQMAAEQWGQGGVPALQMTQAAIEEWGTVSTANTRLVATQIGIEHWASVAVTTTAAPTQARVLVMA